MTEADTCRKFVVPLLQKAGWDNDPHSIAEQRYFTAGRIVSHGPTACRRAGKRDDDLLRYTRDLPLAVVEAKAASKQRAAGLQQAKDYATILGLPFAYYGPEAREILNDLLEKYADDGELQFTLPDVLKVPPISQHGKVPETARCFGGFEALGHAGNGLQSLLYAA
jgi:type I restriction enzyme R subunit